MGSKSKWTHIRAGLLLMLFYLCLASAFPGKIEAVQRNLTLADVQQQALAHKAEIQNLQTKIELLEVNLAKLQADLQALSPAGKAKNLQAILKEIGTMETKQKRDKKKKNIELPPEVSLRLQIAALFDELHSTEQEVWNARLSAAVGAEQAYYDVLLASNKLAFWENCEKTALHQCSVVQRQCQIGAASEADVALVDQQYARAQIEKAKAILAAEAQKRILGQWIGMDVTVGFTFTDDSHPYQLTRDDLELAVAFARRHDPVLYQAEEAEKQAEKDYTAVLANQPTVYLQYEQEIKQYIFNSKGKRLSYTFFLNNYHRPELETAKMWEGDYLLPWMFFQIAGPREWFQPAGISKAVAADKKTAIFALYLLRSQAEEHKKAALATLNDRIYTAYEGVADIQKKRQERSALVSQFEGALDQVRDKQKLTGSEFASIYQLELRMAEQKEELEENRWLYAKAASAFNLASDGFLNVPATAQQGLPQTEETKDAQWKLTTSAAVRRFVLTVQLTPVIYDVDTFQLFYDGQPIGEAVAVNQAIAAADIPHQDGKESLLLQFYKKGTLRYTAIISGNVYQGVLLMMPNNAALSEYEAAKQKQAVIAADIKKLQQQYLNAVEAGNNDLIKFFKAKLDAATNELLQTEAKMQELREATDKKIP